LSSILEILLLMIRPHELYVCELRQTGCVSEYPITFAWWYLWCMWMYLYLYGIAQNYCRWWAQFIITNLIETKEVW